VVASAVGGIPEQFEHGAEGFLSAPGDARQMAAQLAALLADPVLRQRCAEAAVRRAQRYDVRVQVDRFLAWYGEILEHQPAPSS
jgi:glycosyltransferase involved in cell wall biosynthesis